MFLKSKGLAELQQRTIENRYGKLSYDEALMLYQQAKQFAEDCGPFDQATETFIRQRNTMLALMDALNVVGDLNRTEHLDTYSVMISGAKSGEVDTVEVLMLRRHSSSPKTLLGDLRAYAQEFYVLQGKTKLLRGERIDELILL